MSQRPVKQCEGCKLNLGDRCAAFEHPHEKWFHRDCEGYNNPKLIHKYGLAIDQAGAHERKSIRKDEAKYEDTIEHVDGVSPPKRKQKVIKK